MGAKIEDCAFIDLCGLVFRGVNLGVKLNEITNSLHKIAALFLNLEVFFLGKIGKTYQKMH